MVHTCQKAAEEAEKSRGIKAEIIDLRTVSPIDIDTVIRSVEKTGRAIVVQEAQKKAGVAAEVVAQINEKAILHLEAPVLRIAAPDTVYAFPEAESIWLPDVDNVVEGIQEVMDF